MSASGSPQSAASHVAAVVLAGGMSKRMGSPKPLLTLGERPLLGHVIDSLVASQSVWPIVVVTGHAADQLQPILRRQSVIAAHNPDYQTGEMLSSIKTGLRALPPNAEAVLLVLCDQPMVKPATIAALVAAWRARRPRVLLPRHEGKRGHPIVLSAVGVNEIISLSPDATLKTYTSSYPAETIELDVDDPAVVRDIDTPAEFQQAGAGIERFVKESVMSKRDVSRRGFLKGAGVAAAGTALIESSVESLAQDAREGRPVLGPGVVPVKLKVNGVEKSFNIEPSTTLAEVLRIHADMTGTKVVCDRGACSACTVWIDKVPTLSCMTLALDVRGREIKTIEGLAIGDKLHPVQEQFIEHDALQCGFCTPGMIMSCAALLERKKDPTLDDVKAATCGNLCRCGTYPKIFDATLAAAKQMS